MAIFEEWEAVMTPIKRLRHHVSGAIARGEATPITERPRVTLMTDSGEAFGIFDAYGLAHAWLIRNGFEWEPIYIVRLGGVRPKPLHQLARPSLAQ
jgi:hypothetical protein